jgi:hypothetical protein
MPDERAYIPLRVALIDSRKQLVCEKGTCLSSIWPFDFDRELGEKIRADT